MGKFWKEAECRGEEKAGGREKGNVCGQASVCETCPPRPRASPLAPDAVQGDSQDDIGRAQPPAGTHHPATRTGARSLPYKRHSYQLLHSSRVELEMSRDPPGFRILRKPWT